MKFFRISDPPFFWNKVKIMKCFRILRFYLEFLILAGGEVRVLKCQRAEHLGFVMGGDLVKIVYLIFNLFINIIFIIILSFSAGGPRGAAAEPPWFFCIR